MTFPPRRIFLVGCFAIDTLAAQIGREENGFAKQEIEQRGVVCLNDKEEDLLGGDIEELRADNDVGGIGPYSRADEVRVPGNGGYDRNLTELGWDGQWLEAQTDRDQEDDLVQVETGEQRAVKDGECYRRRYGVFDMSERM